MIKRIRKTVIACVLLLCCIVLYSAILDRTKETGVDALDALLKNTVNGRIVDVDGSIGVKNEGDIFWEKDDDSVTIHFGNVDMDFSKDTFLSENIQSKLNQIDIEYSNGKLYYQGKEIPIS